MGASSLILLWISRKGKSKHHSVLGSLHQSDIIPRHMNMDYSICEALQHNTQGLQSALVIYDIACQWTRHFRDRVSRNTFLQLGDWANLVAAVGKFHLSAHIASCFPRFSLNFIHGAGQQDGEILETLWAEFNKLSSSARTMSKAHRAEVFDDHMRDSNWQKLVGMGESEQMLLCLDITTTKH
jgi:hypothetical protein